MEERQDNSPKRGQEDVPEISDQEREEGKTMAILAYILFIIPLVSARDNKFAMFHTEQAIVLVILSVIIGVISSALSFTCIIPIIGSIAGILVFALWIIGLISAVQGEVKELPVVGQYGSELNLVKGIE